MAAVFKLKFSNSSYRIVAWKIPVKLPWCECHLISLMKSKHWFRWWLGAVWQQVIAWAYVDPDAYRHIASLCRECPYGDTVLHCKPRPIYPTYQYTVSDSQEPRHRRLLLWCRHQMEIFSASLVFCEGGFTGYRYILLTKASDAELLFLSLICTWTNSWAKNEDAGDLRRHCAHYDVSVMFPQYSARKGVKSRS